MKIEVVTNVVVVVPRLVVKLDDLAADKLVVSTEVEVTLIDVLVPLGLTVDVGVPISKFNFFYKKYKKKNKKSPTLSTYKTGR